MAKRVGTINAVDPITGHYTDNLICTHFPAQRDAVEYLLRQPEGDEGRSGWNWFVLQNGDVILGFFPTGDVGYFGTEQWREEDYLKAETNGIDRCPVCGGRLVRAESSDGNPEVMYCATDSDHYRSDMIEEPTPD